MLALAAGNTVQGSAGTGAVVAYTVTGLELDAAKNETYKILGQGLLATGAAALYTVPAVTQALVRELMFANTSGAPVAINVFVNGSAPTNQVASLPIPAGGEATFDSTGWKVYDANGAQQTSLLGAPTTRLLTAGAGLTGGGDLSADRTFNVVANADGSIVANADDIQVGVISDAQHGPRGGGTLHAVATTAVAGFQAAADKAAQVNLALGWVNVLDFGADRTGVASSRTALTNAIAALPNGGVVFFPPGTYQLGNTNFDVNTAHITLQGAARYATNIVTTSTTEHIITLNQWYQIVQDITFTGPQVSAQVPSRTAGYAINTNPANASYSIVRRCTFTYQFNCVNLGNTLMVIDDAECRYFKNTAVAVTHNSDHQVNQLTCDNNPGALPTGAGIDVQVCASLLLSNCNVIHSNNALNISPATGVTVPSVKGTNCFFDTSVNGLNCTGAGSVLRCEFTNCWFSSMSANGINMQPAVGGQVNGVTFINCDIYNNIAGTTQGVNTNAQTGKWKMMGCSIAGWTTGINLVPGAAHFPTILGNSIGSISAFGVNTTGVTVTTGTFKGLVLAENDVVDNTTALTLGTVTVAAWGNYRIIDNAGINPRGSVGVIAVPATTVVRTNDTGFRILAVVKWAATAPTVLTINGVSTVLPLLNQQVAYLLEPGSTFAYTGTAPTWTWVAM